MATLHLVRHAKAGSRSRWAEDDELRPLSGAGKRQSAAVADRLVGAGIDRVLSSRYARCWQTVAPLAERLGLAVETEPSLAEEASMEHTEALVARLAESDGGVVLCSHGNILDELLDRLERDGVERDGPASGKKGSTWVVEADPDGRFTRATYTPPPRN